MLIIPCWRQSPSRTGLHGYEKGPRRACHAGSGEPEARPVLRPSFCFPGQESSTMKVLFWDGNGLCLFTKKLNEGGFVWPRLTDPGGTVHLTPVQLALLIEGIDWRAPQKIWRPAAAG